MSRSVLILSALVSALILLRACGKEVEVSEQDRGRPVVRAESPTAEVQESKREETGRLTVRTEPCSSVYIDGDFVGGAPLLELEMEPGDYSIGLECQQLGIRREYTITIKPGEETRLIKSLGKAGQ